MHWLAHRCGASAQQLARLICLALVGGGLALSSPAIWAAGSDADSGQASSPSPASGKKASDHDSNDHGGDSGSSGQKNGNKDANENNAESSQSEKSQDEKNQKKGKNGKPEQQPKNQKTSFDYDQLIDKAKKLAKQDYKPPKKVSDSLTGLSRQDWAAIHFKRDKALWHDDPRPFEVMFYLPGSFYTHAVTVHVIKGGRSPSVDFNKDDFSYPNDDLKKKVPDNVGYAGLKILHALGDSDKRDEVLSFLGASYFRALGADEHYGMSARGLAINTGDTKRGEEFPDFTQFWIVEPDKQAKQMVIYALLDSPSVTGAYKFVLKPGKSTHTHVEETLFTRKAINKLGIAPLTSMFTWGENSLSKPQSYRPEAHDSDGMLISSSDGEWLWQPLVNPQKLRMNQFNANNVEGFGLMQRDRKFADYQDLDFEYEKRPSAWVTPEGDWGKGHLELVEIPSDSEANDNIVLYWIPEKSIDAHQRLHFAYDIKWTSGLEVPDTMGHAIATRVGLTASTPQQKKDQVQMVVDFTGGKLAQLTDADAVQPKVSATRDVTLRNIKAVRNPHTGGWRLLFSVPLSALNKPLQLRAYLADTDGGGLTETWSYLLAHP